MILYQLRCAQSHEFEGWFKSSGSFSEQRAANLISCPHCGTTEVMKALMAPAIATSKPSTPKSQLDPEHSAQRVATPDILRVALRQMRRLIETSCENVGSRFSEEAIKMHETVSRGEKVSKGIYGEASSQERDMLEEKGINFVSIPWGPIDDA